MQSPYSQKVYGMYKGINVAGVGIVRGPVPDEAEER